MLVVRLGGRTDAHTVEPGDVAVIDTSQVQDQVLPCPGFRDIHGLAIPDAAIKVRQRLVCVLPEARLR